MTSAALFHRFQSISISKDQTHIPEHYGVRQLRIDDVREINRCGHHMGSLFVWCHNHLYPDKQITTEITNNVSYCSCTNDYFLLVIDYYRRLQVPLSYVKWYTIWYAVVWYNTMQNDMIQCDKTSKRFNMIHYTIKWYKTIWSDMLYYTLQLGTMLYDTLW